MKLVMVGAGKLGHMVAKVAQVRNSVTIVEKSPERAAEVKAALESCQIVVGDACDPAVLESAGTPHCDAVIVLTGHDEDNLVVCALAKYEYHVKKVITRINNPSNEWLYNRAWGVDVALNSAQVIASLIEEEASLRDIVTLLKLREGEVAIVELTVPDGGDIAGKPLMELGLPRECLVAAVLRGNKIIVPRGDVTLEAGDHLLVITYPSVEESLRARFGA
jgi:trk system potassium uptake protein TrkA